MKKAFSVTTIAVVVLLAASLLGRWVSVEGATLHTLSDIGLGVSLIGGVMLCTSLQVFLDQGHDALERLIGEADDKLAQRPDDGDVEARSLLEQARACLTAAEEAPIRNVEAGAEIRDLRTGILKAREALALL